MPAVIDTNLYQKLEYLYETYDRSYLRTDPLAFLHRYDNRRDQEVVGLIASSLAYGRVEQFSLAIESILEVMGGSPYDFIVGFDPTRHAKLFENIKYRFHTGRDIALLVHIMSRMLVGWGSIESFFVSRTPVEESDMGIRIGNFSDGALDVDCEPYFLPGESRSSKVKLFFPRPSGGSACKRLNLFLRWMVRKKDGIDLGLWRSIEPSELIIPLDTHVSRIAYAIGLTESRLQTWKTALGVTASLAKLDPEDPVKYDFSLCRLGILKECTDRLTESKCNLCQLKDICRYA
jgi:uncharacterized protein (TIGR02757 family)